MQNISDKEQWLKERGAGIGGSDAAVILGVSKWKSPYQLWNEKTGRIDQPNLDELEYIEWGNVLEEPIAKKYAEVTGRNLIDHGRFAIRKSKEYPFMHCTIDREIPPQINGLETYPPLPEYGISKSGDLSIKNVGLMRTSEWEDEPPLSYQIQLQHELSVTGFQWGSFAVLIGGQKFMWLDVPRNERFISMLIEKESEFWDLVQRDAPPPVDASDATRELLFKLYPQDTGESIELPANYSDFVERRRVLKEYIKKYTSDLQGIDNQIKATLKDATIGLLPDGSGFSWKQQHRKEYTVAASNYRVLREVRVK